MELFLNLKKNPKNKNSKYPGGKGEEMTRG